MTVPAILRIFIDAPPRPFGLGRERNERRQFRLTRPGR
jgi:hypothetical protein